VNKLNLPFVYQFFSYICGIQIFLAVTSSTEAGINKGSLDCEKKNQPFIACQVLVFCQKTAWRMNNQGFFSSSQNSEKLLRLDGNNGPACFYGIGNSGSYCASGCCTGCSI